MEATIYTKEGKAGGKITLPEALFDTPWNPDVVHQVVVGMQSNARAGTAHSKDRGEVRGGGKKPWRQKGTGNARHGSRRSPIWRGGGVTFGPRNDRDYTKKLGKKIRQKAFLSVLSQKLRDGEVLFIESLAMDTPKTKVASEILESLAKGAQAPRLIEKEHNAAVIAFAEKSDVLKKSFSNIKNISSEEVRNLNPLDLLGNTYVIFENAQEAVKVLQDRTQ